VICPIRELKLAIIATAVTNLVGITESIEVEENTINCIESKCALYNLGKKQCGLKK
jgi:hypothetical protein